MLSCEALDRQDRMPMSEQRRVDMETFGGLGRNYGGRGRGHGRGYGHGGPGGPGGQGGAGGQGSYQGGGGGRGNTGGGFQGQSGRVSLKTRL
jgi:hypothetical protein